MGQFEFSAYVVGPHFPGPLLSMCESEIECIPSRALGKSDPAYTNVIILISFFNFNMCRRGLNQIVLRVGYSMFA